MKTKSASERRRKKPANAAPQETVALPAGFSFPIVGIGASAGGLEALEQFLRCVPAGSGMAFVIVQHLDPTHKGIMAELLHRVTGMKVMQVKDRTRVRPDCVYVIPPNKDMSILHGVLHLLKPAKPKGNFALQIFATDLDRDAIGKARQGLFPAQHRGRRVAGAADPVLCQRRPRLPGAQRESRNGDLCPAESCHGSALYQAGHLVLPQPADLSGSPEMQKKLIPLF